MPQTKKYLSDAQRQAAYRQRTNGAKAAQLMARGLPPLPAIPTMPGYARWAVTVQQSLLNLDTVSGQMQTYYDERSPLWQESERGEAFVEYIEAMSEVLESLADLSTVGTK